MDETRETGKPRESNEADVPSGGPKTPEGRAAMAAPHTDSSVKEAVEAQFSQSGRTRESELSDGGQDGKYEWVERGIQDVPVDALPQPDGVSSAEDFDHHISHDDALRVTREIQAMKPLIDSGYTSDDFANEDQKNGLDYAHGRQRIFDLYYGSNAIRLNKVEDKYDIVNGRHRIFAAKELGAQSIPANVVEKVRKDGHG